MSEFATEYYWEVREIIGTKKEFPYIVPEFKTMDFHLEVCPECDHWRDTYKPCVSEECADVEITLHRDDWVVIRFALRAVDEEVLAEKIRKGADI